MRAPLVIAGFVSLAAVVLLLVFWVVFLWLRSRRWRRELERQKLFEHVLRELRFSRPINENLENVLSVLSNTIPAPYFVAYVRDARVKRYFLRAVSSPRQDFSGVGPSYSGIALPKKDAYVPPAAMEEMDFVGNLRVIYEGDVPWIVLRTDDMHCLFRIGPPRKKVTKAQKQMLKLFVQKVGPTLDDLALLEAGKQEQNTLSIADDAVRRVATIATNPKSAVEVIVRAFSAMTHGAGGMYVTERDVFHVDVSTEVPHTPELFVTLKRQLLDRKYVIITRQKKEFYDLPESVTALDIGAIVLIAAREDGILALLYNGAVDNRRFMSSGVNVIQSLTSQIDEITLHAATQAKLSKAYSQLLYRLVRTVDSFNPYTVGYADMMMRYSLAIGYELGLSEGELFDLALAASLSNIGVVGVNTDLLLKQGKFTEREYESIKLHCEIGASMIQLATGNERAASYVLYHHERVDGFGYPFGLKGDQIPVGAKILRVVQVFLAKVNGRAFRDALPFDKAIELLRAAAGKDLDTEVVDAFVRWLDKARNDPAVKGKTLDKCYEMLGVPESICQACPVYTAKENCFEVGNTQCKAHGRDCATCLVYTEYRSRG